MGIVTDPSQQHLHMTVLGKVQTPTTSATSNPHSSVPLYIFQAQASL